MELGEAGRRSVRKGVGEFLINGGTGKGKVRFNAISKENKGKILVCILLPLNRGRYACIIQIEFKKKIRLVTNKKKFKKI